MEFHAPATLSAVVLAKHCLVIPYNYYYYYSWVRLFRTKYVADALLRVLVLN